MSEGKAVNDTLSGIWKSSYKYYDASCNTYFWSNAYVKLRRTGDTLIAETLPHINAQYLLMRLRLEDTLATGSWQLNTNDRLNQGTLYTGALQLQLAPDHQSFDGKWVALGKEKTIDDGEWRMTYVGQTLTELPMLL